jgi:hypothetical protein
MAATGMIAHGLGIDGILPLVVAALLVPPTLSVLAIVIARRKGRRRNAWAAVVLASLALLCGLLVYAVVSVGLPPWFAILSEFELLFGAAAILLVLWTGRDDE